ncbi:MAG: DnaJ domain-containing protein [Burkholderiales bacterium]
MKRSLYEMLGIPPDATAEQIQAAYVARLAELNAPKYQGDEDAINETRMLREGYQILTDPARKHHYDSVLSDPGASGRRQVLFMPNDETTRKKLGVQTVVLIAVVVVLSGLVYRHFAKKMEEMDQAYKQEMTQQRLDRAPKAVVVAPVEEEKEKAEPLVPLPAAVVPTAVEAGKGEQK